MERGFRVSGEQELFFVGYIEKDGTAVLATDDRAFYQTKQELPKVFLNYKEALEHASLKNIGPNRLYEGETPWVVLNHNLDVVSTFDPSFERAAREKYRPLHHQSRAAIHLSH